MSQQGNLIAENLQVQTLSEQVSLVCLHSTRKWSLNQSFFAAGACGAKWLCGYNILSTSKTSCSMNLPRAEGLKLPSGWFSKAARAIWAALDSQKLL
mmetsp:Transcript_20378/g.42155  ORF Transcript_20378/g.42155 Transcript_20378/m.42155 type:complete len:97 (-) Transcript_20378:176-466(-)